MTDNCLVSFTTATQVYSNPIAARFFQYLDEYANHLNNHTKLTFPMIEKIVGKPPVIPDSPDMDARLEAYDELSDYSSHILDIELKIRTYACK